MTAHRWQHLGRDGDAVKFCVGCGCFDMCGFVNSPSTQLDEAEFDDCDRDDRRTWTGLRIISAEKAGQG